MVCARSLANFLKWVARFPNSLEAVEVGSDHVAVTRLAEAEHGRTSRRDAEDMLVDENLVIGPVDRVYKTV